MFKYLKGFMSEKKKLGAPRKPDPNQEVVVLKEQAVSDAVLSDTAFGLTKLPDGKNVLVKIKYNALTGSVGVPEIKIAPDNMGNAEYEFREMVDEYIDLVFISKA